MSRRDLTSFQKTRLALAVAALSVSLGACSTVPRDDGFDGRVADAGRESAETGPGLWDRTLYLLGFGETAGADAERRRAASEPRLAGATDDARRLDEVDIALAKEDAVMPSSRAIDVVDSPAWADTAALGERSDEELFDGERVLVENRVDGETVPVSASELTHEVGDSETLWDIAKKTTGDATNWHVLADVNDLAPTPASTRARRSSCRPTWSAPSSSGSRRRPRRTPRSGPPSTRPRPTRPRRTCPRPTPRSSPPRCAPRSTPRPATPRRPAAPSSASAPARRSGTSPSARPVTRPTGAPSPRPTASPRNRRRRSTRTCASRCRRR